MGKGLSVSDNGSQVRVKGHGQDPVTLGCDP